MKSKFTKKPEEIKIIAEGGAILGEILKKTSGLVQPGISTAELNAYADKEIRLAGGMPSFINYGEKHNPFPAALCTSVNDVVVHGIPMESETLKAGDIVGLDIGMKYGGLFTDTAVTVGVGQIEDKAKDIMQTAKKALQLAIDAIKPGNKIGDIGHAIQNYVESKNFSVVRDLVGHGVGYAVHEDPQVPGYGKKGTGIVLEEGMVLAIEPMVCEGSYKIYFDHDGWAVRTVDGGLASHFEHTVVVTDRGVRVLT